MQIAGLVLERGGFGYGVWDENSQRYVLPEGSVQIRVGGPGESGYGFEPDMSDLRVNPITGELDCAWQTALADNNSPGGKRGLIAIQGLTGEKYIFNDPPSITITGLGTGARFSVAWLNSKPTEFEEVAVFKVTSVGDEGQIEDMKILNN